MGQGGAGAVSLQIAAGMIAGLVGLTIGPNADHAAAADADLLFKNNCATCHAFAAGAGRRQGPNLWGVVGRHAGSVDGFPYSPAMKRADVTWTPETLDRWLTDSAALVPGSVMNYRQPDPAVRAAIIDYLKSGRS
ncbi:MAG TPA: c-type cytochrome [Stellaceae bacterium]|nr:c-type cytochrome [Stellaceae bacterium]